jgi:hypothetical protein
MAHSESITFAEVRNYRYRTYESFISITRAKYRMHELVFSWPRRLAKAKTLKVQVLHEWEVHSRSIAQKLQIKNGIKTVQDNGEQGLKRFSSQDVFWFCSTV